MPMLLLRVLFESNFDSDCTCSHGELSSRAVS